MIADSLSNGGSGNKAATLAVPPAVPPSVGKRSRLIRAVGRCVRSDIQLLRGEMNRLRQVRRRAAAVREYLETHDVRCLHVGAGHNLLDGWLNSDFEPQSRNIVYLDVTERLPLPDASVNVIFSEHLIAEFPHEDGAYHLSECFRVLKPNGRVRIATPDLQFLINIYLEPIHTETQARFVRRTIDQAFPRTGFYNGAFVLNHFVRGWGHQFIYDETTLGEALRRAGFQQVRRWPVGVSDEPLLQNIEHHGDAISEEFNLLQTMVLEAQKAAKP